MSNILNSAGSFFSRRKKDSAFSDGPGGENQTKRVPDFMVKIPIVSVKPNSVKRFRVISFGHIVTIDDDNATNVSNSNSSSPKSQTSGPMANVKKSSEKQIVADCYRFQYAPVPEIPDDLVPGIIPDSFLSVIELDGIASSPNGLPSDFDTQNQMNDKDCDALYGQRIFLETRESPFSKNPEFRIAWVEKGNILCDWCEDVDGLWIETLQMLEECKEVSEEALQFLDADPLSLFGIADPVTQKALEKSAQVPVLKCVKWNYMTGGGLAGQLDNGGAKPCLEEWFSYLNADIDRDSKYKWVIEAFAEVELPLPWSSYLGVGSIICFLNNESQETTWKHPFYDYFTQLLNHCRNCSPEEHIRLRLNRMLWSYERESSVDISLQQPLLSPLYVMKAAEIWDVDLSTEGFLVRTLKVFLNAFAQQYRLEEEIDLKEINWSLDILENERMKHFVGAKVPGGAREKAALEADRVKNDSQSYGNFRSDLGPSKTHYNSNNREDIDPVELIKPHVQAQLYCVECQVLATNFCPQCEDLFCEQCYERLHSRGNRQLHRPNHLIPCCLCRSFPAKLQCTYTYGNYCLECYSRKHVKTIPKYLDMKPLKIDYRSVRKEKPKVPEYGGLKGKFNYDEMKNNITPKKKSKIIGVPEPASCGCSTATPGLDSSPEKSSPETEKSGKNQQKRVSSLKPVLEASLRATSDSTNETSSSRIWAMGEINPKFEAMEGFSQRASLATKLGDEWHAFHDLRGVKYFFNFKTGESMRRPAEEFIKEGNSRNSLNNSFKDPAIRDICRQIGLSDARRKLNLRSPGLSP